MSGWVSTNILPENFVGRFIGKRAFRVKEGALAGVSALLDTRLKGGEFVTNYKNFWLEQSWSPTFFKILNFLRIREVGAHILSMYVLLAQKYSYQFTISTSSPESYDDDLAKGLYDWSMKAISAYK